MNVTILCSDEMHPVNQYLNAWINKTGERHNITVARSLSELTGGDFLFLVSCSALVQAAHRDEYRHTLVLHASDLPKGRGWSPHVWEIIDGCEAITLSLIEAEDKVDTGRIWLQRKIPIKKTALWNEVNHLLFTAEIELLEETLSIYKEITPRAQDQNVAPTYRRKRTPQDSRIDPLISIRDQFDLIRISDPERYPAWFEVEGQKFKLVLEKIEDD